MPVTGVADRPRCVEPPARRPDAEPLSRLLLRSDLRMMSANCSGSVSRPRVLMVNWNCWPLGTGCWPICPAAICTFCWLMAVTTSMALRFSAAILSASSQTRRL